eukprot:TRINITY_DN2057_c1_g1_i1.p4 TRINITY_DN2057_c1_g1~~TRINITY_DN2057_c1_g1_i1.p4  ORF type:complete len:235 (-),score=18.73 TRINITY_DN2057_c1_g1_i1:841-1545(-)
MQQESFNKEREARLAQLRKRVLPSEYVTGLQNTRWPGRCHMFTASPNDFSLLGIQVDGQSEKISNVRFFIDGAHTEDSVQAAGKWFYQNTYNTTTKQEKIMRVLLFYCQPTKNPQKLLSTIRSLQVNFDRCIFTLINSSSSKVTLENSNQVDAENRQQLERMVSAWKESGSQFKENGTLLVECTDLTSSLRQIMRYHLENQERRMDVFVVGSLFLVGDVLNVLERQPSKLEQTQ